jgi:hypothetical protein
MVCGNGVDRSEICFRCDNLDGLQRLEDEQANQREIGAKEERARIVDAMRKRALLFQEGAKLSTGTTRTNFKKASAGCRRDADWIEDGCK